MYVCRRRPLGVAVGEYILLLDSNPDAKYWGWTRMTRNATAYVRGRIWHPDHKTVVLDGCHRVLINTENQAPGERAVVFLD